MNYKNRNDLFCRGTKSLDISKAFEYMTRSPGVLTIQISRSYVW